MKENKKKNSQRKLGQARRKMTILKKFIIFMQKQDLSSNINREYECSKIDMKAVIKIF